MSLSKAAAHSDFKMLSASGSLIAIPLDQLSGRLKKHGIKCEKNPDPFLLNKPGLFSLRGIDGDLGICLGAGQVCEQFFRAFALPHSVLAAMEKEFNVEFVNEDDPRFWGCASKDELAAIVRKTEQRIDLLDAAQAAWDEKATDLEKRAISSRVSRTLGIVEDRIWDERDALLDFLSSFP